LVEKEEETEEELIEGNDEDYEEPEEMDDPKEEHEIEVEKKPKKEKKNESLFLPMNFNLMLDYFNNKQNMRVCQNRIKEAMNTMTARCKPDWKKKRLRKIDVPKLMDDFRTLFSQKHASEVSSMTSRLVKKVKVDETAHFSDVMSQLNSANVLPTHITTIKTQSVKSESTVDDNMYFTNYLKKKLDAKNDTKNIVKQNYEKYRSIKLATDEAKKCMATKSTAFYSVATSTKYNPISSKFQSKARNTTILPKLNLDGNKSLIRMSEKDNNFGIKTVNEFKRSSFI
jgi:hypothetical protein